MKTCGHCGSTRSRCVECGKEYPLGTESICIRDACYKMMAPVECDCGFVVSVHLDGVIDYDMDLIPWKE